MSKTVTVRKFLQDYDVGNLAVLADVYYPDTQLGRNFLTMTRDAVAESVQFEWNAEPRYSLSDVVDALRDDGTAEELVDGAVPIYTSTALDVMIDLGLYNEPLETYGETTIADLASAAAYQAAERLVNALLDILEDAEDVVREGKK